MTNRPFNKSKSQFVNQRVEELKDSNQVDEVGDYQLKPDDSLLIVVSKVYSRLDDIEKYQIEPINIQLEDIYNHIDSIRKDYENINENFKTLNKNYFNMHKDLFRLWISHIVLYAIYLIFLLSSLYYTFKLNN